MNKIRINDGMDVVQEKHTVVQSYVDDVNPKTVIAISREVYFTYSF